MVQQYSKEIQWLLREKYWGIETPDFFRDIERIKKGEPLDYVIGFVEFLGCSIDLSKHPFIPRPETEFWVEKVIQNSFSSHSFRCLDIFAGSGCIGISILKHVSNATVDFAEKEKKFVEQIKINAKLNGIGLKRYRIIQSNIFSRIKGKYDYIFANPPYIAKSKKEKVQKSVLNYEPKGALFGGENGLVVIEKFLKEAKKHLNPGGTIYMEFDSFQKPAIKRLLKKFDYQNFTFFKDQYKKWRYVVLNIRCL